MMKKVTICGITDMADDRVCIGGYDFNTHQFIRIMENNHHLTSQCLLNPNKLIATGSIATLNISEQQPIKVPPHIEDTNIILQSSEVIKKLNRDQLYPLFRNESSRSLTDIFGTGIESIGGHPVIPEGMVSRSMGLLLGRECEIYLDHQMKKRCNIIDCSGAEYRNIPVSARDEIDSPLGSFINSLIFVGLTRLWKKDTLSEPYYWMIVPCLLPI